MASLNKNDNPMPTLGSDSASSAFSLMEPMLRPGPQASMELRFGDCSLKLERTESAVRVLLEGGSPALPRPRELEDYLALLAMHDDLRQIAVIDANARRIVTLLDHGAAVDRMYRGGDGSQGIWSGVQLVDKLSNQRIAPISFDLVRSIEFDKITREVDVALPIGEAPKLLAQIEPWIVEHDFSATDPASHEKEEKWPAVAPLSLRARLLRALRTRVKSALIGPQPIIPSQNADKVAVRNPAPEVAAKPSMVRVSDRPLLTASGSKRFLNAALLVEEARVRLVEQDDPHYVYALRNFEGFPISLALRAPVFRGAPPTTFEATIHAETRPGGRDMVRLVLPPMKDLEESALRGLRQHIAARTGATVIFGEV